MSNAPETMPTESPAAMPGRLAVTPDDVRAAAAAIAGSVLVTECDQSRTLSEICGCNLWLKFENLPVHRRLQGARRAQPADGAVDRTSDAAA